MTTNPEGQTALCQNGLHQRSQVSHKNDRARPSIRKSLPPRSTDIDPRNNALFPGFTGPSVSHDYFFIDCGQFFTSARGKIERPSRIHAQWFLDFDAESFRA